MEGSEGSAEIQTKEQQKQSEHHNASPLPQGLHDRITSLSQQLEPLKQRLSSYFEDASWKLNESDLADLLKQKGIPEDKIDSSLQLIKWFEEKSVVRSYVRNKDDSDYQTVEKPYRFKVEEAQLLRQLYVNVENPNMLLQSIQGIVENPNLDAFCNVFSQIGNLSNIDEIAQALSNVKNIKPQRLSDIRFLEDDDNVKPVIKNYYSTPVPEPLSYLNSLTPETRSKLLQLDTIDRLNNLVTTIQQKSKSEFKLDLHQVPALLEIAQDKDVYQVFVDSIDWKDRMNAEYLINVCKNFKWINTNIPSLIGLAQKGFNTGPYINRFCNGFKDISLIDFKSENGVKQLLEQTQMYGSNLEEIKRINNDDVFTNNVKILNEMFDIRIEPRYLDYYKEKPFFYTSGNPEDIKKVATFYKLSAESLDFGKDAPLEVLDRIFNKIQPVISAYTLEEITEICTVLTPNIFEYFLKNDLITDKTAVIKRLFTSNNVDQVKANILLFSSERTKAAIDSSDSFVELSSWPYSFSDLKNKKSKLFNELISGETIEAKLILLEQINNQPEKMAFLKKFLADNKEINIDLQSFEEWNNLFLIPEDKITQIFDFIQNKSKVMISVNNDQIKKVLSIVELPPDQKKEIEETILNTEQVTYRTFLQSQFTSEYIDLLFKNHKKLFALSESFKNQLYSNCSITGYNHTKQHTTSDQRLSYMLELADHQELLSIIPSIYINADRFQLEATSALQEMNKNPDLLEFTSLLSGYDYLFNPDHIDALKNLVAHKDQVATLLQNRSDRNLLIDNIQIFASINPENFAGFVHVIKEMNNSPSKDIYKLKDALLRELAFSRDPEADWEKISAVFEKNHLPMAGKVYKIFEILHPAEVIDRKIEEKAGGLSPTLVQADSKTRYNIIGHDLLKIHLMTGNSSLKDYITTIKFGESLFSKVESNGLNSLLPQEHAQLELFLAKMESLYANTLRGKGKFILNGLDTVNSDESVLKRMHRIRRRLGITQESQSFHNRINELFLEPLHIHSLDNALELMEGSLSDADKRNRDLASSGTVSLSSGDLLKGVNSEYILDQLQNGIVSNEYFGNESDSTPFDTDTSMILNQDIEGETQQEHFKSALTNSLVHKYGDIVLVIKNRGQFRKTAHTQRQLDVTADAEPIDFQDTSRYELFNSLVHGNQHWGIRTGIPFTEIDAIIIDTNNETKKKEIERVKFSIAQYGTYIPIVDEDGKVVFTPEDYDEYKIEKSAIQSVLEEDELNPADLLETYKHNGYLRQLLSESAGVHEGWTIEEHTGMVLTQFETYFAEHFSSEIIDKKTFRFILSLHDIGKSLSIKHTGGTEHQHEYTLQVLEPIIATLGFSDNQKLLISAIVDQDYLGDYIKSGDSPEYFAQEIKSKAQEIDINPKEFLKLLQIYYMSDASAYTAAAVYVDSFGKVIQGVSSLENLFEFNEEEKKMRFSPQTEEAISSLETFI